MGQPPTLSQAAARAAAVAAALGSPGVEEEGSEVDGGRAGARPLTGGTVSMDAIGANVTAGSSMTLGGSGQGQGQGEGERQGQGQGLG